ncbi:MAG: DUF4177 domain-containing protein [Lactobacillales bacterium]|jgi:hypothetical protein|nr:DUF4177 domain-containing protein [Lactobacillales bacterium]
MANFNKIEKWEYKTISHETTGLAGGILEIGKFNEELNAYGNDSWELVSGFDTNQNQGANRFMATVFKRLVV